VLFITGKDEWRILRNTKQRLNKKSVFGFDIETYNDGKSFYCGSIVADRYYRDWKGYHKFFLNKQSMIDCFKQKKFKNSYVFAIYLSYDSSGLLFGKKEINEFLPRHSHSKLLWLKSYIHNKEFCFKKPDNHQNSIMMIDLLNLLPISAEKVGELVNIPKLKKPHDLGKKPKTKEDKQNMKDYNIQDSKIACHGGLFAIDSYEKLGATFKPTVASNSMSIFTNKYLDRHYFGHKTYMLYDLFKAYYGGRTEVFVRGLTQNPLYQSDVVSLYPSQMTNPMPNPNTIRYNTKGDINDILRLLRDLVMLMFIARICTILYCL